MTDVVMTDSTKVIVENKKKDEKSKEEQDLYTRMKELQNELEMLNIQENYLKDEQRHLKSEYVRSKEEVSINHYSHSQIFKSIFKTCDLINHIIHADQKNPVGLSWNRQLR